jgi:hypothetical protein
MTGRPSSDARRDAVAQRAARLLRDGARPERDAKADDGSLVRWAVEQAIRASGEAGVHPSSVPPALVRAHVRGLALEELGAFGYREQVAALLENAEEVMALLEELPDLPRTTLVGRTARGDIDADPVVRIRVDTEADVGTIAARLVDAGFDEPSFATVDSHRGRLSQIVLEDCGVEYRITRCPPAMRLPSGVDLRQGRPVPSLDRPSLARLIADLRG